MRVLSYAVGVSLILLGLYRIYRVPEYKPAVFEKPVYTRTDAKQIVADGADVYLLTEIGNILRISESDLTLIDSGTGTKQIVAAGGALYILKYNGNTWTYQVVRQKGATSDFQIADPGTGTKQIEVVGDTLYVLKEGGRLWRRVVAPGANENGGSKTYNLFIPVASSDSIKQITSSGSILYALRKNGNIWKYAPTLDQSLEEIYDQGNGESIEADGGALYFIRTDGTPCKYQEASAVFNTDSTPVGQSTPVSQSTPLPQPSPSGLGTGGDRCRVIVPGVRAKKIDALGGVVYILTNESKIIRYSAETDTRRDLTEAGADNKDIAAFYQDLFVIKTNGSVKRYNEGRLKR